MIPDPYLYSPHLMEFGWPTRFQEVDAAYQISLHGGNRIIDSLLCAQKPGQVDGIINFADCRPNRSHITDVPQKELAIRTRHTSVKDHHIHTTDEGLVNDVTSYKTVAAYYQQCHLAFTFFLSIVPEGMQPPAHEVAIGQAVFPFCPFLMMVKDVEPSLASPPPGVVKEAPAGLRL